MLDIINMIDNTL